MIRQIDRPEVFKHLPDHLYCMEAYNDDGVYAYFGLDLSTPEWAALHLSVEKFNHVILKKMLQDWRLVKRIIKRVGVERVVASNEGVLGDHRKWIKFIKHFGFEDVTEIVTSVQEI
jgi:hypothetical protein